MATSTPPSLSIFFPCYNDSKTIGYLIKKANLVARQLTHDYEIIVIDDGSADHSRKLLLQYKKKYSRLKLVFHEANRGYGAVLKTGFAASVKKWVFYTDGDGQYDVGELILLWSLMVGGVNFVNGIKMERNDYSYRIVLGNLYALLVRWAFRLPTYDVDCDFRLVKKSLMKKINLTCTSGAVCAELVKKSQSAGAIIRQVSIHHYPRKHGKSQFFRPRQLVQTAIELIQLWWKMVIKHEMV